MNSRQAIDLLNGLEQYFDDYCELNDEGKAAFRMAITALELFGNSEQLSSALPEIIRCKDCKYWSEYEYINGKLESFPWCELNMTFSKEDDFCSHAER